jgi:hypothetical protein
MISGKCCTWFSPVPQDDTIVIKNMDNNTDGMKAKDAIGCSDAPTKKAVYLNEPMLVIDPSHLADRLYRHRHSHGEMTAHLLLYHNKRMKAVDPSRLADRSYRHHHLHGESTTETSLITSEHMKFVWKLIEWENGEATIKSLSETKTRHILQPPFSIKNHWLGSMSTSLLLDCFYMRINVCLP